jgi:hypothetical protein
VELLELRAGGAAGEHGDEVAVGELRGAAHRAVLPWVVALAPATSRARVRAVAFGGVLAGLGHLSARRASTQQKRLEEIFEIYDSSSLNCELACTPTIEQCTS